MNCLRMDLRRSIFCKKFVLIVMATLLVLFASTWNDFKVIHGGEIQQGCRGV